MHPGAACHLAQNFFKMAMLTAAQLLDELMGQDRNLAPDEKKSGPHYSDPEVITHFILFFMFWNVIFIQFEKRSKALFRLPRAS